MNTVKFLLLGLILLVGFALWSKYVDRKVIVDLDFATTVKIQERIDTSSRLRLAQAVGDIMEGSKFFASPEVTSVAVVLLTILFVFIEGSHPSDDSTKAKDLVRIDKKHGRFATFQRLLRVVGKASIIPMCFALVVAAEVFGKTIVHHPAPPFFMIKNPTTVFPKYYINEQYSYPSGHVARAVFIGVVVSGIMYGVSRVKNQESRIKNKGQTEFSAQFTPSFSRGLEQYFFCQTLNGYRMIY